MDSNTGTAGNRAAVGSGALPFAASAAPRIRRSPSREEDGRATAFGESPTASASASASASAAVKFRRPAGSATSGVSLSRRSRRPLSLLIGTLALSSAVVLTIFLFVITPPTAPPAATATHPAGRRRRSNVGRAAAAVSSPPEWSVLRSTGTGNVTAASAHSRGAMTTITRRCLVGFEGRSCRCGRDPGLPESKTGPRWREVHKANVDAANAAASASSGGPSPPVDVVFLGDSITEGWNGMMLGRALGDGEDIAGTFRSLFSIRGGGRHEGLALGIAADTSQNLLWRLRNGELPDGLMDDGSGDDGGGVWWLLIGTNDLGNRRCSEDMVLAGILSVMGEVRSRRPRGKVVLNSLLPRSYNRRGSLEREDREDDPVLWNNIRNINERLLRYSEEEEGVRFFNATDIFLARYAGELRIDTSLMRDRLHPTAAGYRKWGEEIVRSLHEYEKSPW